MVSMIGRTIAKYRVVEHIGGGGVSSVYKAYQPGLDRYVALKILSPYHAEKPEFGKRFFREAKAIARLHHPNIVPIYDFGEHEGMRYIAMRYVEGSHTLKEEMQHPLRLARVVDVITQIAAALDHAHQHSVIHRDVKPSNILIDGRWAMLTDFGLAKTPGDSESVTRSGVSVGTPAYMSPEQGQGLPIDHRSDIYALGIIVYEILTGEVPHNAETPFAIVLKRATEPPTMPTTKYPEVTDGAKQVLLQALAIDPGARFQSAGAFVCAFAKATAQNGTEFVAEPERATRPTPRLDQPDRDTTPERDAPARVALPWMWRRGTALAGVVMVVMLGLLAISQVLSGRSLPMPAPAVQVTDAAVTIPTPVATQADRRTELVAPTATPIRKSGGAATADNGLLYKVADGDLERLHVVRLGGADSFRLTESAQRVTATFCPNSRRVIVEVRGGDTRSYYVMDSDGRDQLTLATEAEEGWAVCSDDGQRILAAWRKGGHWEAVMMLADGSRRVSLAHDAVDYTMSWDRTWRVTATSLREGDEYALYLSSIEGGDRREVARGTSNAYSYYPAVSPDGRWVLYRTYQGDALFDLHMISTDGSPSMELATQVVYPRGWFSPSGTHVLTAMMPGLDTPFDLNALDLASGRTVRLLSGDEVGGQYSPRDEWITAYARRDGLYHLYVADSDGLDCVEAVEPGIYGEWGSFSPDGRWALASVRQGEFYHLYLVRAGGLEVQQVVDERQHADWYADGFFSPDGRRLWVQMGRAAPPRSSLYLVDLENGQWVELARDADWQLSGAFTNDGEHIVFDSNRDGRRAVYIADYDGRDVRWLADGFEPVLGPGHQAVAYHHNEPSAPPPAVALRQAAPAPIPTSPVTPTLQTRSSWAPPTPHTEPPGDVPTPTPLPAMPSSVPSSAVPNVPMPSAALAATAVAVPEIAVETMAPPTASAAGQPVTLGLRNPWGTPGETHTFDCSVRTPYGTTTGAQGVLNDDAWSYLTYPDNFAGASLTTAGEHLLQCVVEGQEVADRFFVDERIGAADAEVSLP